MAGARARARGRAPLSATARPGGGDCSRRPIPRRSRLFPDERDCFATVCPAALNNVIVIIITTIAIITAIVNVIVIIIINVIITIIIVIIMITIITT